MKKRFSPEEHEQLKRWQKTSAEAKFNWLVSALEFNRAIKRGKKKERSL